MPSATTTDGRVLDSRAANADAGQFQRKMNNSRFTPPILPRIQRIIDERVHVFSVSPWAFPQSMGEWGMFIIPACPEGKKYVEFMMPDGKPVPGLMIYHYPQDENRMGMHEEDGRDWANKLLYNDVGIAPAYSLNRYGVFVAAGDKPTKEELDIANAELNEQFIRLVEQARDWSTDPIKKQGINAMVHHVAARKLNLSDEAWMIASNPQGRKKCKMCGAFSDPDVIKCGACKEYIFDHQAYAAMQKDQAAQQIAAGKVA